MENTINTLELQLPSNTKLMADSGIGVYSAKTFDFDLGEVKKVYAIKAVLHHMSNDAASSTLTLSCGENSYTETTLGTKTVPHSSKDNITYETPIQARYIRANSTYTTWNGLSLAVAYED